MDEEVDDMVPMTFQANGRSPMAHPPPLPLPLPPSLSSDTKTLVKRLNIFQSAFDAQLGRGHVVVWNLKQLRTWQLFLEHLTDLLQPPGGAICRLHTPVGGSRVRGGFAGVVDRGKYVALTHRDQFAKAPQPRKTASSPASSTSNPLTPQSPLNRLQHVNGRLADDLQKRALNILIFRNRDIYSRPIAVLLKPFQQADFELAMRAIDERVILNDNQPIRKLFDLEGNRITRVEDLQNNVCYVVAGKEAFAKCAYGKAELPRLVCGKFSKPPGLGFRYPSKPVRLIRRVNRTAEEPQVAEKKDSPKKNVINTTEEKVVCELNEDEGRPAVGGSSEAGSTEQKHMAEQTESLEKDDQVKQHTTTQSSTSKESTSLVDPSDSNVTSSSTGNDT